MSDESRDQWQPWIDEVCARLGIDSSGTDVDAVLELTAQVAHRFLRPMAPMGAFLAGVAIGRGMAPDAALDAVAATLPE